MRAIARTAVCAAALFWSVHSEAEERRHDGLYLRVGLGPSWGRVVSRGKATESDIEISYQGFGSAAELTAGGTIGRGVVLGGSLVLQDIRSPSIDTKTTGTSSITTKSADGALGFAVAGVAVDWFPDDRGGAHAGALLGFGRIGLEDSKGDRASGGAASLFGGYDFWIGREWSLGGQARALVVRAERDVPAVHFEDSALGFQLALVVLYH